MCVCVCVCVCARQQAYHCTGKTNENLAVSATLDSAPRAKRVPTCLVGQRPWSVAACYRGGWAAAPCPASPLCRTPACPCQPHPTPPPSWRRPSAVWRSLGCLDPSNPSRQFGESERERERCLNIWRESDCKVFLKASDQKCHIYQIERV